MICVGRTLAATVLLLLGGCGGGPIHSLDIKTGGSGFIGQMFMNAGASIAEHYEQGCPHPLPVRKTAHKVEVRNGKFNGAMKVQAACY